MGLKMTQQEQKKITQAEVKKMVDEMLDSENDYEFGVSYSSRMKENDEPMYYEIVNNMSDSLSKDGYIVEDWND
jgi:transposase